MAGRGGAAAAYKILRILLRAQEKFGIIERRPFFLVLKIEKSKKKK